MSNVERLRFYMYLSVSVPAIVTDQMLLDEVVVIGSTLNLCQAGRLCGWKCQQFGSDLTCFVMRMYTSSDGRYLRYKCWLVVFSQKQTTWTLSFKNTFLWVDMFSFPLTFPWSVTWPHSVSLQTQSWTPLSGYFSFHLGRFSSWEALPCTNGVALVTFIRKETRLAS